MDHTTLRSLRIADALAWPGAALVMLLKDTQTEHLGGVNALLVLLILIWAARKLGHALDGYREPGYSGVLFNPFNPLSWVAVGIIKLVSRREGEYRFFTLTVVKIAAGVAVIGATQWFGR